MDKIYIGMLIINTLFILYIIAFEYINSKSHTTNKNFIDSSFINLKK